MANPLTSTTNERYLENWLATGPDSSMEALAVKPASEMEYLLTDMPSYKQLKLAVDTRNSVDDAIGEHPLAYLYYRSKDTAVIHKFFVPEFLYMLKSCHFDNKLIRTVHDNTWVGQVEKLPAPKLDIAIIDKFRKSHQAAKPLKLMPHQQQFIEEYPEKKLHNFLRGHILSFDQGLGKTITAIALMLALQKDYVFIVAPKNTLVETWKNQLQQFFGVLSEQITMVGDSLDGPIYQGQWFIFNHESMDKISTIIKNHEPNFRNAKIGLVCDESHKLLRMSADRTKNAITLSQQLAAITSTDDLDLLMMSGTPIKCCGDELIPMLIMLDPLFDERARKIFRQMIGNKHHAHPMLHRRLDRLMTRVLKSDLSDNELPPKLEHDLFIPLPDGNRYCNEAVIATLTAYERERWAYHRDRMPEYRKNVFDALNYLAQTAIGKTKEFQTYLERLAACANMEINILLGQKWIIDLKVYEDDVLIPAMPQQYRQPFLDSRAAVKYLSLKIKGEVLGYLLSAFIIPLATDLARSEAWLELIESSQKKTIVFSSYNEPLTVAADNCKRHGYKPVTIYTDTASQLTQLLEQFKTKPNLNPLCASLNMLSTGATLIVANTIIFLNLPWRSVDYAQATDRIHRIGQDADCHIYRLHLDTGNVPNISTRLTDIMEWSNDRFNEIVEGSLTPKEKQSLANEFTGMGAIATSWKVPLDALSTVGTIQRLFSLEAYQTTPDAVCGKVASLPLIPEGYWGEQVAFKDDIDAKLEPGDVLLLVPRMGRMLGNGLKQYREGLSEGRLFSGLAIVAERPDTVYHYTVADRKMRPEATRLKTLMDNCFAIVNLRHIWLKKKLNLKDRKLIGLKLAHYYHRLVTRPRTQTREFIQELHADAIGDNVYLKDLVHAQKYAEIPRPMQLKYHAKFRFEELLDSPYFSTKSVWVNRLDSTTPALLRQAGCNCKHWSVEQLSPSQEWLLATDAQCQELLVSAKPLTRKQLLAQIQEGDILLPRRRMELANNVNKIYTNVQALVTGVNFSSCKMYSQQEVIGYGITTASTDLAAIKLEQFCDDFSDAVLLRHRTATPQQKRQVTKLLRQILDMDRRYGFGEVFWSVLHKLFGGFNTKHDYVEILKGMVQDLHNGKQLNYHMFCSSIVAILYDMVGAPLKLVQGVLPYRALPSDVLKASALEVVGIYHNPVAAENQDKPKAALGLEAFTGERIVGSMEAAVSSKRKAICKRIYEVCDLADPSGFNSQYYHQLLDKMTDKQFAEWMQLIKEGKWQIHLVAPNMTKHILTNANLVKCADKMGLKLMHRLWMTDKATGEQYLTDNEYLVLRIPIRRQQQFLDEKRSIATTERQVDSLTGQVTGDSKAASFTNPEIQVLMARGLTKTLEEFINVRGGNIGNYGEFKRSLEENGSVTLNQMDPSSRTRSAVMAGVLLTAMCLDNNF